MSPQHAKGRRGEGGGYADAGVRYQFLRAGPAAAQDDTKLVSDTYFPVSDTEAQIGAQ